MAHYINTPNAGIGLSVWRAIKYNNLRYGLDFEEGVVNGDNLQIHPTIRRLWNSNYAVLSQDNDRLLNFFNPAAQELFGYTQEEAIGMPSEKLVPKRFRKDRNQLFEDVLKKGIVGKIDAIRLRKDCLEILVHAQVMRYNLSKDEYGIAAIGYPILNPKVAIHS